MANLPTGDECRDRPQLKPSCFTFRRKADSGCNSSPALAFSPRPHKNAGEELGEGAPPPCRNSCQDCCQNGCQDGCQNDCQDPLTGWRQSFWWAPPHPNPSPPEARGRVRQVCADAPPLM